MRVFFFRLTSLLNHIHRDFNSHRIPPSASLSPERRCGQKKGPGKSRGREGPPEGG